MSQPVQAKEEAGSRIINERLEKECPPEMIRTIKRITYYISKAGLSFDESCTLAQHDAQEIRALLKEKPALKDFFDYKMLEYKKDLLMPISKKAKEGDDKLAMWLLEKKFPDEFAKGGKGQQGADGDGFLRELFKKSEEES